MSPPPGKAPTGTEAFFRMLWEENPVFVQILGICSALAVTNKLLNTAVMGGGLIFTTGMSALTVSLLRAYTPRRVRMMVQILIIAAYVILVKIFLDAFLPSVSAALGAYVGLIITNCIVMGRCEAFAAANAPGASFLDGLGAGAGYALVLLAVAAVREPLGLGTLFDYRVLPEGWVNWNVMVIAPGGFFMLAVVIWVVRAVNAARERRGAAD
jgi:Na+-transporting NADH:ubiquinone oxidoreductase subunit D